MTGEEAYFHITYTTVMYFSIQYN